MRKAPTISSSGYEEDRVTTERRRFIATAGGVVAATVAATVMDAPNINAQPKVQWRMSTAFTAVFDIHQGAAQRLAKIVEETTGGRFRIEVFPGGQIMQPFDCFAAASQGKIEAFLGSPQYWAEPSKEPALEWCPPGHGDVYGALRRSGLLGRLLDEGFRYAMISNSDNLGARVEPRIPAARCNSSLPMSPRFARRRPSPAA